MKGRRGGEGPARRRVWVIAVAVLVALLALGAASPAVAKKKKKKSQPAVTPTPPSPFTPRAPPRPPPMPGKTHISGGGWAVRAPHFVPDQQSPASERSNSHVDSVGTTGWTTSAAPRRRQRRPGSLTAFARCESNKLGSLATVTLSGPPRFLGAISIRPCPQLPRGDPCPQRRLLGDRYGEPTSTCQASPHSSFSSRGGLLWTSGP